MTDPGLNAPAADMIYILGTGRSGSTILEILLSHGTGCCGTGELSFILQDGWKEDVQCSCGEKFTSCGFWQPVMNHLNYTSERLEELLTIHRKVDWHTGFLKQLVCGLKEPLLSKYFAFNADLVHSIQATTGKKTIIDSSKYPGRLLGLSRTPSLSVATILLTRSPEGLLASFSKPNKGEQPPKSPLSVMSYYVAITLMTKLAGLLSKGQVLKINYEEMISNPVSTLNVIEAWSGISFEASRRMIESSTPIPVGHIVTGNRLRKKGSVTIATKDERICNLSPLQRVALVIMRIWKWMLRI